MDMEQGKRENINVTIVDYSPEFRTIFKELNVEWIEQHWKMEEADYSALNDPEGYILKSGGFIFIALLNDEAVGTCALLNKGDSVFELAKMAVTERAKGMGIGYLLGTTVVNKAMKMNPKRIYLESNTILKPAISLYKKLGFKKCKSAPSPYERCNIQMELDLIEANKRMQY
jgi:GNAT superfamily N-acetyltransferase